MLDLSCKIAVHALPERKQEAERLARRYNLPLAGNIGKVPYYLYLGPERLELQDTRPGAAGAIYVDFVGGRAHHRRLFGGGKNQTLARAVGIKANFYPTIIDATAGLGRDTFVLATIGCHVTMIERSPILAALLEDGLQRAQLCTDTADIARRINLVFADTKNHLEQINNGQIPNTIYIDPMYPHRTKSALVKKEMRVTRELVGEDNDAEHLVKIALSKATKRIVVKRPRHAAILGTALPHTAIHSKNTRYDIYTPIALK